MSDLYGDATLISRDEVRDIEGKIRCLESLLKHPRHKLPELQPFIAELWNWFEDILVCKDIPFSLSDRIKVELILTRIGKIEDILIRVILQEETCEDVIKHQQEQTC